MPVTLFLLLFVGVAAWYGGVKYADTKMHRTSENIPSNAKSSNNGMAELQMASDTHRGAGMSDAKMAAMPGNEKAVASLPGYVPITVLTELQQQIGIRFDQVQLGPLNMSVSTVGIVRPDETRLSDVYVKTEGWIHEVFVDFMGKEIAQGTPLLSIYSPEFYSAQEEYLVSTAASLRGPETRFGGALADSALLKLELLDIPDDEIKALQERKKPNKYLTLRSPVTGTVLTKSVFAGEQIKPSTKLYEIADLSVVWVQAKVYEYELPHVELGQSVIIQVPAFPEKTFEGKVVFIQAMLNEKTRTTDVRIELQNRENELKIGMFADVQIMHTMGDGLLVSMSSVIRNGTQDVVFRVGKDNLFTPVAVKISPIKFGNQFHVLEGLSAGDKVVASANFLIDSESRLRAGGGASMSGMEGMDMSKDSATGNNAK